MYMRLFHQAMQEIDVLVAPTFRAGLVGATNLTGHPCVVVPNGFTDQGQPTSISFLSGLYRESHALLAAHAFQQRTDFHRRRPDLDGQPAAH